jgi:hypothetical protein
MVAMPSFRSFGLLGAVILAACSSPSSATSAASAPGKPSTGDPPPSPPSHAPAGVDAGPAAPLPPLGDAGSVTKDAGAEPQDASVARDCGSNLTAPIPANVESLWAPTNPVSLGEGFDPSRLVGLQGEHWAIGTAAATPYPGSLSFYGDAVSTDDISIFEQDSPTNAYQNPTQLTYWATMLGSAETRLTFGWGARQWTQIFSIESPQRTAFTPASPAQFVTAFLAERVFVVVFGVEVDSACKRDAIGDVLGGIPKAAPVLSDVGHRAAISDVLVRNGAQLTFHVLGNKPHPAVDALFASSHCTTADLAECQRVLDALHAENDAWTAASPDTTMDAVSKNTDPVWSALTFRTGDVSQLP